MSLSGDNWHREDEQFWWKGFRATWAYCPYLSMPSLEILRSMHVNQAPMKIFVRATELCNGPITFWNVGNTWHGKPLKILLCFVEGLLAFLRTTLKLGVKKFLQMLKLLKHAGREYQTIGTEHSWNVFKIENVGQNRGENCCNQRTSRCTCTFPRATGTEVTQIVLPVLLQIHTLLYVL